MADVKPKRKTHGAGAKSSGSEELQSQQDLAPSKNGEIFSDLQQKIQAQFQKINDNRKPSSNGPRKAKALLKGSSSDAERANEEGPRGKKRNNLGTVVARKKDMAQSGSLPVRDKEPAVIKDDDVTLREEVFALGGTAEDLDLINGINSDSELEGTDIRTTSSKAKIVRSAGLEKGMSNILKEIALAQGEGSPLSDSSEMLNGQTKDESDDDVDAPLKGESNLKSTTSKPRTGAAGLKYNPRPDWFSSAQPNVDLTKQPKYTLSQYSFSQLYDLAKSLLDSDNEQYKKNQQHSSSHSFYNTVIVSGTLSDKISALTLAVQESPVHNVKALEALVALAKKRSRAQAVDVLRALKDLFAQGSLLPSDRKLYPFSAQPAILAAFGKVKAWNTGDALPKGVEESHLIVWAFESWLKEQYFEVLKTLEIWCNDEIEFSKSRAISYVFELLREKPEQESNLLRLLINKLGDPVKKIASQTSYLIMQLLSVHPAMKGTVISAIEADFIFRPGQSLHGKYYAAVTLNQTALSSQEKEVAVKLLDIYFGLFIALLKPIEDKEVGPVDDGLTRGQQRRRKQKSKKVDGQASEVQTGELREKLISALLTGVNRAYPYADKDGHDLGSHLDTLFKITHSSNFNTSIQAMMLIQQLSSSHQTSTDRFYRTLYESLLDPRLVNSSKQQLYLNLLHRALNADLNLKRVKAFVKRILQILTLHDPSFICGAFFLLSDLQSTFPGLKALLDQPEEYEVDGDEVFRDVDDETTPQVQSLIHADRRNAATAPPPPNAYNARKRDPEHSNAENACAWDVLPFLAHFHPSVNVGADHLLRHAKLPGKPDLTLHTLSHFLDRFVYRNPKAAGGNLRGHSIMQPMASDDTHAVLISSSAAGKSSLAVNSEQFRTQKDEEIAADEVFFHKYFSGLNKEPAKKKSKKDRSGAEEENGSVGDEEEAVWKAMMESAPDLEGDNDSDEGLEMSDLESEFDDEEGEEEDEMSDGEAPDMDDDDVDDGDDLEDEDEQQEVFMSAVPSKKGRGKGDSEIASSSSKERKRKMKGLPTFASASEYAKMLEDDRDEDMG